MYFNFQFDEIIVICFENAGFRSHLHALSKSLNYLTPITFLTQNFMNFSMTKLELVLALTLACTGGVVDRRQIQNFQNNSSQNAVPKVLRVRAHACAWTMG